MDNKINISIPELMIGTVLGAGLMWLGVTYLEGGSASGKYSDLSEIAECRDVIGENGYPDFDADKAIDGYVKGGLDSFSGYKGYDPVSDVTEYVNESGTALASGFKVAPAESGRVLLTSVEEDKAAYNCGLRAGDEIDSIDGISVIENGYENTVNKLLGKEDTKAELTVVRSGMMENITFERSHVYIRGAEWDMIGSTGYIKITYFDEFLPGFVEKALGELSGAESYIIDLRQNLGGDTHICVDALKCLAPGTSVHLTEFDGTEHLLVAEHGDNTVTAPVIVLTDNNTASSSEIMAAAIRDYNQNSLIVGEKTFGKGLFQATTTLESGALFTHTVGTFTVNSLDNWNGKGIEPDVTVEMDPALIGTDDDIQLKKAIELLD